MGTRRVVAESRNKARAGEREREAGEYNRFSIKEEVVWSIFCHFGFCFSFDIRMTFFGICTVTFCQQRNCHSTAILSLRTQPMPETGQKRGEARLGEALPN